MAAWGTSTWNTGSFGTGADNSVVLTGTSASVTTGSVSIDAKTELGWGRDQWGARPWGAPDQIVIPTTPEDAMTMSLNSVSITAEINGGWSRFEWGKQAWGIAGTLIADGDSVTASLGTATVSIDVSTGPSTNNNQLLSAGLGSVTAFGLALVEPVGFPLTNSLGTADAGPDAMATGNQANMGLGTVEAFNNEGWGRLQWGINNWGDPNESAQVDISGIAMTAALGSPTEVTGDANIVANTLNVAQITLGQVDPAPDAAVTGNFMIGSLGTVVGSISVSPVPTGIGMTANLGTALGIPGQTIIPTGFPLLSRVASVSAFTDATATFDGFGLTMNINSANALIWNQINTGSAPIDPPGWREVVA